jgi:hypothetical protein
MRFNLTFWEKFGGRAWESNFFYKHQPVASSAHPPPASTPAGESRLHNFHRSTNFPAVVCMHVPPAKMAWTYGILRGGAPGGGRMRGVDWLGRPRAGADG